MTQDRTARPTPSHGASADTGAPRAALVAWLRRFLEALRRLVGEGLSARLPRALDLGLGLKLESERVHAVRRGGRERRVVRRTRRALRGGVELRGGALGLGLAAALAAGTVVDPAHPGPGPGAGLASGLALLGLAGAGLRSRARAARGGRS